ncbi:hypothetical protein [Halobacillus sp. B23F22_1]|uniref:hypothetical protein n=1 Tax=Halobacillus sp. B23F22_1 TaxID=3459514 RepID=UPI00373EF8D1
MKHTRKDGSSIAYRTAIRYKTACVSAGDMGAILLYAAVSSTIRSDSYTKSLEGAVYIFAFPIGRSRSIIENEFQL